jgi:1-acyl-sn-glycerol-3-phosphate acyltransferase
MSSSRPSGGAPAGPLARAAARLVLRTTGWRVQGHLPDAPKCVVIAAPHTSNWDLLYMLAVAWTLGVRPAWLGKRELFRWPLGPILRRLGGIPVDRGRRSNLVQQVVAHMAAVERCFLVVPPSGTRARATHWKSGFYHVARTAGVPIVCAFLDYRRKLGGLGLLLHPSGDVARDMAALRGFYGAITARHPQCVTPVRLAEEDAAPPAVAEG